MFSQKVGCDRVLGVLKICNLNYSVNMYLFCQNVCIRNGTVNFLIFWVSSLKIKSRAPATSRPGMDVFKTIVKDCK